MKKTLFIIFSVFLMGCQTAPKIETVTVYKDRLISIPDNLLKTCPTTQPPEKNLYIISDAGKREQLITNYSISLIKDVKNCNDQINEIIKLQSKQKSIIEGTN